MVIGLLAIKVRNQEPIGVMGLAQSFDSGRAVVETGCCCR